MEGFTRRACDCLTYYAYATIRRKASVTLANV